MDDICMLCRYGHKCPFMRGADDLHHAYMYVRTKHKDLTEDVEAFEEKIKKMMKKEYGIPHDFDLGTMTFITGCDKYEKEKN